MSTILKGTTKFVPGTVTTKLSLSTEHLLFRVIVTDITSTGLKAFCMLGIPNHNIKPIIETPKTKKILLIKKRIDTLK